MCSVFEHTASQFEPLNSTPLSPGGIVSNCVYLLPTTTAIRLEKEYLTRLCTVHIKGSISGSYSRATQIRSIHVEANYELRVRLSNQKVNSCSCDHSPTEHSWIGTQRSLSLPCFECRKLYSSNQGEGIASRGEANRTMHPPSLIDGIEKFS